MTRRFTVAAISVLVLACCAMQGCATRRDFVAYVFDRQSREPVANVQVEVQYFVVLGPIPRDLPSGVTDSEGRVVLKRAPDDAPGNICLTHEVLGNRPMQNMWIMTRDEGIWLVNYPSDVLAVWLVPESNDRPPDMTSMAESVPERWRKPAG